MQLTSTDSIESALAEFIAAAFSPEERAIARMKARLAQMPPRGQARIVLQHQICETRLKQLQRELTA